MCDEPLLNVKRLPASISLTMPFKVLGGSFNLTSICMPMNSMVYSVTRVLRLPIVAQSIQISYCQVDRNFDYCCCFYEVPQWRDVEGPGTEEGSCDAKAARLLLIDKTTAVTAAKKNVPWGADGRPTSAVKSQ